jgi:FkbM family methyltransferase
VKHLKSFLLRRLDFVYQKMIEVAPLSLFSAMANTWAMFKGSGTRFSREKDFLIAKSEGMSRFFIGKSRGIRLYQKGFAFRAEQIASDYLLSTNMFSSGDVIVDCGANSGDLELYFLLAGIEINYVGFEPSPKEFECLKRNTSHRLENRDLHCVGLGNRNQQSEFYLSSQSADSSIIAPYNYSEKIMVEERRLDDIASLIEVKRIKLLKVEAEGYEPEVLMGSSEIIAKVEYVSVDMGPERGRERTATLVECLAFLSKQNFDLVAFNPIRLVGLFKARGNFN